MKLLNIKKEDQHLTIEELFNLYNKLTFENDVTEVELIKHEDGFNVVGYTGYDIDFDMEQLDNVLEIINDIKDSNDILTDWADEYLNSIESNEFKVTRNCINSIYLARELQTGRYTWENHINHCSEVYAVAGEVIQEYFNYIDELLENL